MATQVSLVVPTVSGAAVVPANADATGNYIIPGNVKRVLLRFENASGASITVTLDDVNSVTPEAAEAFDADVLVPVAAGAKKSVLLSGRNLSRFLDAATGKISWTYSAAASVTVEAHSL